MKNYGDLGGYYPPWPTASTDNSLLDLHNSSNDTQPHSLSVKYIWSGASNGNFRENICSEDDLRTRIFGTFVVKFLACLPLLGFSNIYKMV